MDGAIIVNMGRPACDVGIGASFHRTDAGHLALKSTQQMPSGRTLFWSKLFGVLDLTEIPEVAIGGYVLDVDGQLVSGTQLRVPKHRSSQDYLAWCVETAGRLSGFHVKRVAGLRANSSPRIIPVAEYPEEIPV